MRRITAAASVTAGLKWPPLDDAEHDDQAEEQKAVDEADHGEVGAELRLAAGRDEEDDDR
jgi:hypothetical protein